MSTSSFPLVFLYPPLHIFFSVQVLGSSTDEESERESQQSPSSKHGLPCASSPFPPRPATSPTSYPASARVSPSLHSRPVSSPREASFPSSSENSLASCPSHRPVHAPPQTPLPPATAREAMERKVREKDFEHEDKHPSRSMLTSSSTSASVSTAGSQRPRDAYTEDSDGRSHASQRGSDQDTFATVATKEEGEDEPQILSTETVVVGKKQQVEEDERRGGRTELSGPRVRNSQCPIDRDDLAANSRANGGLHQESASSFSSQPYLQGRQRDQDNRPIKTREEVERNTWEGERQLQKKQREEGGEGRGLSYSGREGEGDVSSEERSRMDFPTNSRRETDHHHTRQPYEDNSSASASFCKSSERCLLPSLSLLSVFLRAREYTQKFPCVWTTSTGRREDEQKDCGVTFLARSSLHGEMPPVRQDFCSYYCNISSVCYSRPLLSSLSFLSQSFLFSQLLVLVMKLRQADGFLLFRSSSLVFSSLGVSIQCTLLVCMLLHVLIIST